MGTQQETDPTDITGDIERWREALTAPNFTQVNGNHCWKEREPLDLAQLKERWARYRSEIQNSNTYLTGEFVSQKALMMVKCGQGKARQESEPPAHLGSTTLHLVPKLPNVDVATPAKRTGKNKSRRTGQSGHIEKSGKWWVVRWWMDVDGQEKRIHMTAKICLIDGPEALSTSARKRRAHEIITASGADTEDHFNRVVKGVSQVKFDEQAEKWLRQMQERNRKPVAPSTISLWGGASINGWFH